MVKRIAILSALVVMAVTLAGCGFKHPVQWNEAEERERVAETLDGWATGIEEYDIDAMAGDGVLAAGFRLIMQEGSAQASEPKDAAKLLKELRDDEGNQLAFRKSKAEGGAGYQLRFDVHWDIDKINRSSATVIGAFAVWETIQGGLGGFDFTAGRIENGWWNSDNGLITIELVRTPDAWKMVGMTIVFRCGVNGTAVANASPDGLGFGRLPSVLGW